MRTCMRGCLPLYMWPPIPPGPIPAMRPPTISTMPHVHHLRPSGPSACDLAMACAGCTGWPGRITVACWGTGACLQVVPFLLDPAGALGRHPPGCEVSLPASSCSVPAARRLLDASCVGCTRKPLHAAVLRSLCLPEWSVLKSWLHRVAPLPAAFPVVVPPSAPVLDLSSPTCRGAVADARLGLP